MRKDLKEVKREACRDLGKEGTRQRKRQVQRPCGRSMPGSVRKPVGQRK